MGKKIEVVEENVVVKKKPGRNLIIFVSIVILAVTFLCVGLGIGAFVLNNNSTDKCSSSKENILNDNEVEENTNVNKEDTNINVEYKSSYEMILDKVNDLSKIEHLNRNINNVSELTNQELLQFAINYLKTDGNEFTLDQINEIINEYFGRTIEGEDIYCLVVEEEVVYYYDESTKIFKHNTEHSGHGGGDDTPIVLNRIIDIDFKDSEYIVKVKKAFTANIDVGISTDYYRTYSDMTNKKNLLFRTDNYTPYPRREKNPRDNS